MSAGDMAYTVPLGGTRVLMQPPFTPAGVVINNRTDRIVTVQDGRGWSRSVRPGAVGRFAIDRPDSNYIGQLAAVATTGECRVTFTQTPIVETGEPAAEGPRYVNVVDVNLDNAVNTAVTIDCSGGSILDLSLVPNSAGSNASIFGIFGNFTAPLTAAFGMALPYPSPATHIVCGGASDIPMPSSVSIACNTGGFAVHAAVRAA